MNKSKFSTLLKKKVLILDGAMGTELQKRGYLAGIGAPEELNLAHPERIIEIHREYLAAGANVILANTFGANRLKLTDYQLEGKLVELNQRAIANARKAAAPYKALVAADIGPLGAYLTPLGPLTFEKAYTTFAEQARALAAAKPDLIIIETMAEIREVKAALLAVKDNFNGPVIAQMTFNADGTSVTGTGVLAFLAVAQAMGADGVGLNCSVGPKTLARFAAMIARHTSLPISFKPNAGMPKLVNRETVFPGTQNEFVEMSVRAYRSGVNMLGGCCGTTPAFIAALSKKLKNKPPVKRKPSGSFLLSSRIAALDLNASKKFLIIGERINPTNRRAFQDELSANNFTTLRKEAQAQVRSGAALLDINMGVPGADEPELMRRAVEEIQEVVSVPLCLDSSHAAALEAGLRKCAGKPIINSVNGDAESLKKIFPLAKRYGAALIALTTDAKGIPKNAKERLAIARRIIAYAKKAGFPPQELIIDYLTLSASAKPAQVTETLRAIAASKKLWPHIKTVLGVSNVSFGMPNRQVINAAFLALAKKSGLDLGILNPHENWDQNDALAKSFLLNEDPDGKKYIAHHGAAVKKAAPGAAAALLTNDKLLYNAIVEGNREEVAGRVKDVVKDGFAALDIANLIILKALTDVGERFNRKEYFLPQVIRSAEAAQLAFGCVKPLLKLDTAYGANKIVLATVKGDVHDIGKNIVAAVFESHGWDVIDLGKNVGADGIVEAAVKNNCPLIGLSALMTTTMLEMEKVVQAKTAAGIPAKILIGGAPVTDKFAREISADGYARDAVEAIEVAKKLLRS